MNSLNYQRRKQEEVTILEELHLNTEEECQLTYREIEAEKGTPNKKNTGWLQYNS